MEQKIEKAIRRLEKKRDEYREKEDDRKPSETTDVYWLYAFVKGKSILDLTPKLGKWLIFVEDKNVDTWWKRVKKATKRGKLGPVTKVSTARETPHDRFNDRVICAFTRDFDDTDDVNRVRDALEKMGVDWAIPYKTELATLMGLYSYKGDKKIARYIR